MKPFAFPELLARTRVLLRRTRPDASERLKLADLEMDVAQRSVARGGHAAVTRAPGSGWLSSGLRGLRIVRPRWQVAFRTPEYGFRTSLACSDTCCG